MAQLSAYFYGFRVNPLPPDDTIIDFFDDADENNPCGISNLIGSAALDGKLLESELYPFALKWHIECGGDQLEIRIPDCRRRVREASSRTASAFRDCIEDRLDAILETELSGRIARIVSDGPETMKFLKIRWSDGQFEMENCAQLIELCGKINIVWSAFRFGEPRGIIRS